MKKRINHKFTIHICIACISLVVLLFNNSAITQEVISLDSINLSTTSGVENLLSGQVAGLKIKQWTGTAGLQSDISIHGLNLDAFGLNAKPLIMVNGMPFISNPSFTTGINPLTYYNFDQIEKIEVYKNIDQLTGFGILAPNGAINIVIKEGQKGALNATAKVSTGIDYFTGIDTNMDKFYNYNTEARKDVYASSSFIQNQNLLIDGGGKYGSYLFGANNFIAKGGINKSGFSRQNLFLNAKYNLSDDFSMKFYGNLALLNRKGRYSGQYEPTLRNSFDEEYFMDDNDNIGLLTSVNLSYQLSSKLSVHSLTGISYESSGRNLYIPSNILEGDVMAGSYGNKRQYLNINTYLDYENKLSEALNMKVVLGHQLFNSDFRSTSVSGLKNLENGGSDFVKVVIGYNANQTNAFSDFAQEKLLSFYSKLKFEYKNKMIFDVITRADGSSLYERKWKLYPAIALTYNFELPISVKATYGKIGIRNKADLYRGQLEASGEYYSGNILGVRQLYTPFKNDKSVGINQMDILLHSQLSEGINIKIGYHNRHFKDFTYKRYLPNIHGLKYEYETGMELRSNSIDFTLKANWIQYENFSWRTNLNFSASKTKIHKAPDNMEQTSLNMLFPLGSGDGLNTLLANQEGERTILKKGKAEPFGGVNNYLRYGKLTFGMTWVYSYGGLIAEESFSSRYSADHLKEQFPLKPNELPFYYVEDHGDGMFTYQGISSLLNTSFIRLDKLSLSYNIYDIFKQMGLKSGSLTLTGRNLLSFSKYPGINPEENESFVKRSDLKNIGTALPSSIIIGISIDF